MVNHITPRARLRIGAFVLAMSLCATALAKDAAKAAEFYEDGLARYEKGDTPGAIIQLKNALQQNPDMLTAHVLLGRALLDARDFQGADASFEKALQLGVSPREIAAVRARLLMSLGRSKDLLSEISADGLLGDDLVEVLTLRAKALALMGDPGAAEAAYRVAVDSRPDSVVPYLEYVPFLIQQGRLEEAKRTVAQLKEMAPKDARVWNLVGSMDHVFGHLKAALEGYNKALELDPGHIDARVARAAIYVDLKDDLNAQKDLDFLAENAKREPRSAYLRSLVAARAGRTEAAMAALNDVANLVESLPLEYANANEQLLMLGALSNNGVGNREKAKEYLDRLVRRYPSNRAARKLFAGIYLDDNDFARALSAIEPVLSDAPDDPQANLLAGRAQLGFGRYADAKAHLEKAVRFLGDRAEAQFALGLSSIGDKHPDEGLVHLSKAVALAPRSLPYVTTLVSTLQSTGQAAQAKEAAEKFVRLMNDRPEALNLLASVHMAQSDFEEARKILSRALLQAPKSAPIVFNLARSERLGGRPDDARVRLQTWLESHREDPRAMFELGMTELQRGEEATAIRWLRKALGKQPDQSQIALPLVEALSRQRDHKGALTVAKEIALRHPDDLVVQAVLGQAFLAAGDRKSAQQTFKNMTRVAEFEPLAQVRIGRLAFAAGFVDDARYNVRKALMSDPHYGPAHALAIDIALSRGDLVAAEAALKQLKSAADSPVDLLRYEGVIAVAKGDDVAALRAFKARHKTLGTAETAINLARMYRRVGDPVRAKQLLQDEFKRTQSVLVLDELAVTLEEEGHPKAAVDVYRQLVAATPDHPERMRRYALALLHVGDVNALTVAERALALAKDQPAVLDTTGWIRLDRGDVVGALALLREARLRAPDNPEIRYHLAAALAKSQRIGEAKAELREALDGAPKGAWVDEARRLSDRL